jgi:hypothetical protein
MNDTISNVVLQWILPFSWHVLRKNKLLQYSIYFTAPLKFIVSSVPSTSYANRTKTHPRSAGSSAAPDSSQIERQK